MRDSSPAAQNGMVVFSALQHSLRRVGHREDKPEARLAITNGLNLLR
jgi:hypothetical protein